MVLLYEISFTIVIMIPPAVSTKEISKNMLQEEVISSIMANWKLQKIYMCKYEICHLLWEQLCILGPSNSVYLLILTRVKRQKLSKNLQVANIYCGKSKYNLTFANGYCLPSQLLP